MIFINRNCHISINEIKKLLLDEIFEWARIKWKGSTENIEEMRGGDRVTSQNQEETYKALEKYGVDLVQQVKNGKQDPIIGRDEEIRDVIRILSRKPKIILFWSANLV